MPNRKILISILISLFSLPLISQVNTYSPYSRFGLGELNKPGFTQNRSMGGTGIALRSNKVINLVNPAAYTALDSLSFVFDFGLTGSSTNYSTSELDSRFNNFNLDHLAIAFTITDWWKASAGVTPFTSVGYNIIDQRNHPDIGLLDYYFQGNGGLNRFYLGTSVMLFQRLSLGVNLSNLFGFIQNTQSVNFPGKSYNTETYADERLVIRDMVFNLGLQYHEVFQDKFFITLGAIYDPERKLNASRTSLYQNIFPGSPFALNDSTVFSPEFILEKEDSEGDIIYPSRFGTGLSFGIPKKLVISGEYQYQNWSESSIMGESDSLVNSNSMNFGLEYTPDADAFRGYFNRVHYRLGGYYTNSYLRIRGEQLKDYGITFGVGLPFRGTKTTFNLGVVLGQRGTTDNNLVKENYGIINLSFTLHDFWFFKRKFD
ncbi:MAG: hypothetical protein ACOCWA_08010 [Bacteroidota bacterium]